MTLPAQLSPRVAALLEKTRVARGRLIFGIDATASREPMRDMAAQLMSGMFEEVARIGGLDVQLLYYGGANEFQKSAWLSDAHPLVSLIGIIRCVAGATQIRRVLRYIRAESAREKVSAAIFIGDAVEESPAELYAAAADLGVPVFWFQEGDAWAAPPKYGPPESGPPLKVETVFRDLARLTNGAYGRFDANAARQLGELLSAAAAFATGGLQALANQHTDSARRLLTQMKHDG